MTSPRSAKKELFSLRENPVRPAFPRDRMGKGPAVPVICDVCVALNVFFFQITDTSLPAFPFEVFFLGGGTQRARACLMSISLWDMDKNPYLENILRSNATPALGPLRLFCDQWRRFHCFSLQEDDLDWDSFQGKGRVPPLSGLGAKHLQLLPQGRVMTEREANIILPNESRALHSSAS